MKTIRKTIEDFFNNTIYIGKSFSIDDTILSTKTMNIIIHKNTIDFLCIDADYDLYDIFIVNFSVKKAKMRLYGRVAVFKEMFNGFWAFIHKGKEENTYLIDKSIYRAEKKAKEGIHILEPKKSNHFYVNKIDNVSIVFAHNNTKVTDSFFYADVKARLFINHKIIALNSDSVMHALINYTKFCNLNIYDETIKFYLSMRKSYQRMTKKEKNKIQTFIGKEFFDNIFFPMVKSEDVEVTKKVLYNANRFIVTKHCADDEIDVVLLTKRISFCTNLAQYNLVNKLNAKKYIHFTFDEGDLYLENIAWNIDDCAVNVHTKYGDIPLFNHRRVNCTPLTNAVKEIKRKAQMKIDTIMKLSGTNFTGALKILQKK